MRRALHRIVFLALVSTCAAACSCKSERAGTTGTTSVTGTTHAAPPIDVRHYVPVTPGDRWRVRHEPGGTFDHHGITATNALGHAVMHGSDHVTIDLYDVREDAAYLVTPEGTRILPVVVRPTSVGQSTRYEVAQGAGRGSCTLEVTAMNETATVAGSRFEKCFTQVRTCAMPAGGGLPLATTITEDETYCPSVGRVAHRFRASPPLPFPDVASDRRTTLVSFHVRGAPVLGPDTTVADRLIVLPSDASAACGGQVASTVLYASATSGPRPPMSGLVVPADANETDVLLAFAMTDGPMMIEARRADDDLDAYVGADVRREGSLTIRDDPRRIGLANGSVFVRITPNASCADRASRLEPLIRSLLR